MKRLLLLIPLLFLFPLTAKSQTAVRYLSQVITTSGRPLAGATIAICNQPASFAQQPCSPLATIYTDPSRSTHATNPIHSDGLGNYEFYADPGTYSVQIYGQGITEEDFVDVPVPCLPFTTCGGVGGAVIQTNEVNNTLQNLLDFQNGNETPAGKQISASNPSGGIEHFFLKNVAPSTGGSTLIGDISNLQTSQVICSDSTTHLTNCTPAIIPINDSTTGRTFAATDRGHIIDRSNAGAMTDTIAQAGTAGFEIGYHLGIRVPSVSGVVSLTSTTSHFLITNGSSFTNSATLTVNPGQYAYLYDNGTDYEVNLSAGGGGSGCSVTGFADQSVLFIHPLSTCAVDTNLLWDPTSGKQWLLVGGPAPIAPFTFDNFSGTTDNYIDWGDTAATFARQRATGSGADSCILCIVSEQNSGASVSGVMPGITIVAVDNSKRTAGGADAEGISIFSAGNFTSDSTNANVIGARVEADISGGTSTGLMNVTGFWSHASHTVGQSPSPSSNSEATEYYAESIAAGDFKLRTGVEIDFTSQTSNPALDTSSYCGLIIGAICNATGNTDGGSWALYVGGITAIPIKNRSMFNGNVDVRGSFNQTAGSSSFTGGSFAVTPLALTNPPAGPTLTPAGGGATTWGYKYVARAGSSTTAASAQTTTTAAATLDSSHTITINCPSLTAGALNYDIYRTTVGTSPSTTGFIGRLNSSCLLANGTSLVDNGLSADGTTAPTTNNTGSANFVQAASTIHALDIYSVPMHSGDFDRAMLVLNCIPFGAGDGCNGNPGGTPTQLQIGFDGDNIAIINSTGNQVAFTQETVQFFGAVKAVDNSSLSGITFTLNPTVVKTSGDLMCASNDGSGNCTTPIFELQSATGFTQVKRINAHEGTALVSGDFALGAGWGSTAAVSAVTGTDQAFNLTITTGGSGIAANPTTTLTFHDGTWTNSPIFTCSQTGGNDVLADITFTGGVATATTLPMIWNGTPTTAKTYIFSCVGMGR